jgi:hypothetical protein
MALIELELSPAWKRVVDDETGVDPTDTESRTTEPAAETERIEVVEETPAKKRRLLTPRRVLGLGLVVGGVVLARRVGRVVEGMQVEAPAEGSTIDVEATDETPAE